MFFRQYQLSCLSAFSYLIGDASTGRAVVLEPQRDITGTSMMRGRTFWPSSG
jgi:hydroxyacylglutathione hydrolase